MPQRLVLALVGGLLLWLCQPGHDLWPAAPLGVALLAVAVRGTRPRRGYVVALAGGLACMTPLLAWSGVYVGPLPWLALALLQSLYVGLVGLLCAAVSWRDRSYPWVVGGAWVTAELARSTTPYGGFPWGRLAFGVVDAPYARVAQLLGAPGVTFVVAATGGFLAVLLDATLRRWVPWLAPPAGPATAGSQAAATAPAYRRLAPLAAAAALTGAPLLVPLPTDGPTARIMAVQGNVPQAGLEFNAQRRAVLDNHANLTRVAAQQLRARGERVPDLVLWPENASDIDPLRNRDAAAVIRGAVDAMGAPVVVGAVLAEPEDHVTNAALLYEPGRDGPTQRYDKRHPVPFGEYIPQRQFFRLFSDQVDLVRRDFVGGHDVGVLRVPRSGGAAPGPSEGSAATAAQVAAGMNICFEVAYDDLVRDGVRAGADVVVVQTNNATFGWTDESVQQLAISRLRAIEHGRSVVHISNVGVSSLITADGVPHGWSARFAPEVLTADLPLRTGQTLATRLGDLPAMACGLVTVSATVIAAWRRRLKMT